MVKFRDKRKEKNEGFIFMGRTEIERERTTLLHYAVMNDDVEIAKLLIEKGAGKYG